MTAKQLEVDVIPLTQSFIFKTRVGKAIVNPVNQYLDEMLADENAKSHAHKLVGQITRGKQLEISLKEDRITPLINIIQSLGLNYYDYFYKRTEDTSQPKKVAHVYTMWSVHSYAGDYNPLHDHGAQTLQGLSGSLYTKIPPAIQESSNDLDLRNASGNQNGYLQFVYGDSPVIGPSMFKIPQNMAVRPVVGDLYLWPSWLEHMVYPFDGEGERRSIAFNISFHKPGEEKSIRSNDFLFDH
ncbi:TPA: hypothetical protein EYM82_15545 [Candidatus Poribacteria bacterium]|nr:hypothetical protein [Candidatus Poribacteria bacterium]